MRQHVRTKSATRRLWRLLRHGLATGLIVAFFAFVVLWLMFQHRPTWYRPAMVTDAGVQRAQADTAALADSISHQIVRGEAFEVTLVDEDVNEWLACLPHLLPEDQRPFPPSIKRPAVHFEQERIRIGAHYMRDGWQAIFSAGLLLDVSEDGRTVTITLTDVRSGSLPVFRFVINQVLEPLLRNVDLMHARSQHGNRVFSTILREVRSVDELFEGVNIRNRFVWPNGERPFRIDSITIDNDETRLRIEPL